MIPAVEHRRRRDVITRAAAAMAQQDVVKLIADLPAFDWTTAWPDVIRELVATGQSPSETLNADCLFPWAPRVLFRGQSLADYQSGRIGLWWTPYPRFAEWFARSKVRDFVGDRVVLAALDPEPAILHRISDDQFVVNPMKLDRIEPVAEPPAYTAEEEDRDINETSILDRVPHGFAYDAVAEWRERTARVTA